MAPKKKKTKNQKPKRSPSKSLRENLINYGKK
jgi:hypothetical protein